MPTCDYSNGITAPRADRGTIRVSESAAATATKLPSSMITSCPAASRCRPSAARVLWPEPVSTASRHASSDEAAATPTLMPSERITLRRPPASPVRLDRRGGHDRAVVGRDEQPLSDAENGQRQHHESEACLRSIHDGEQQGQGEHADQHARRGEEAGAEPVVERASDRRHQSQHHRNDREPQPGRKNRILVDPHEHERHQEEKSEQRRIGQEAGDIAGQERAPAEQREVDEGRLGTPFAANEQCQQDERQHRTADEGWRRHSPCVALVQHGHDGRERRRNQQRALPVEAALIRQVFGGRKQEPSQDGAGEPDRHVDPEHPAPVQQIQHQPSERGPGAQTDGLGRRQDAERAAAPRGTGGRHHDGDAVRRQQRRADPLQDAKGDEHREAWRKAAQRRAQHEQQEATGIQQLAPHHVGEAAKDRQKRRHGEQIGDGDPAHGAQSGIELELELRQQQLRDAGIDLAHEGADADGADHEQPIGGQARDAIRRRRLASLLDGVAEGGDRGRAVRYAIHAAIVTELFANVCARDGLVRSRALLASLAEPAPAGSLRRRRAQRDRRDEVKQFGCRGNGGRFALSADMRGMGQ